MKRLLFDVPKWHLLQHRDHRGRPLPAPSDDRFTQLEDELFERLYCGDPERLTDPPDPQLAAWADQLHSTLDQLPAFNRLSAECRGNPAAAAAAVETLLEKLRPTLPPAAPAPPVRSTPPLRPAALSACLAASKTVEDLHDATQALSQVLFESPGTLHAANPPGSGARAIPLAARLRGDRRLQRIALLAGRLKRIAASKRRQRVRHGADELTDVEQGDNLARALPSELAKLAQPRRRLAFFRSLLERQVLQYQLVGSETLGKGPLVLLLDKSGSMATGDGSRDIWASALALALLEHAHSERRPFALVAFNGGITYDAIIKPGDRLPEEALFVSCDGGTSISTAVERGLEIIRSAQGALRKADLVLITDGQDNATSNAASLREQARALNVSLLGLAIAFPAEQLSDWCDHAYGITDLSTVDPGAANALFAE
jgi:uncharacterized protein with von Willebrand factor type A (vWA) domain